MSRPHDLLPQPRHFEEYAQMRGDPARWLPAMRVIGERHGLDTEALYAEGTGTHVVFRAGRGPWIKLFAPLWPEDHAAERHGLRATAGVEDLAVPALLAEGELEGWPYVVIEHLEGRPLGEVWIDLPASAQAQLAESLGRLMARLHAIDVEVPGPLARDWPAFVATQRAGCVRHHARAGASAAWQDEIGRYVEGLPALPEPAPPSVLLHADVTDEHVLVAERGGRWEVTGLIDFGDAMMGDALYEFAAPAAFMLQQRPHAQQALLLGYGFAEDELTPDLARRLTGYLLLHRFSRLPVILRFCPDPVPRSMAALQKALWDL